MDEWSVLIEAVAPAKAKPIAEDVIGEAAAALGDLLADHGPAPAASQRSWSVRIATEGASPIDAANAARALVEDHREKAGLPAWPLARIEATRWDLFEAELEQPNFPELVGSQEVAEMLGVSRQRLHELRSSGRFPEPMLQLAATPVWLRPAIEAFLEGWERRPGRPKSNIAYYQRIPDNGWIITVPGHAGQYHHPGPDLLEGPFQDDLRRWLNDRGRNVETLELRPLTSDVEV